MAESYSSGKESFTKREREIKENIFQEFLGQEVKAPFRDGSQYNIARGKLVAIDQGFLKISGDLGIIVINERNIVRISKLNS